MVKIKLSELRSDVKSMTSFTVANAEKQTEREEMLPRNLNTQDPQSGMWQQLGDGVPTVAGFAGLCSRVIAGLVDPPSKLSAEANAILVAAAGRGVIDIRISKDSFDSLDRFVAVCVEVGEEERLLFKQKANPRQTLRFLEGFRELCQAGLVMHHAYKDFSLTLAGFEAAEVLDRDEFKELLAFAEEVAF